MNDLLNLEQSLKKKKFTQEDIFNLNKFVNSLDNEFANLKIFFRKLDQQDKDVTEFYEMLDDIGISFYKFKSKVRDFIKQELKEKNKL
ncbi:hypothetical protein IKN40_04550 [bacterium]|nr:hypothetical protein [bacterium]